MGSVPTVGLPIRFEAPGLLVTYGPSIDDPRMIRAVIAAGATGVRLTFSYGTLELQLARARAVRDAAAGSGRRVALIADLQGEKCRLAAAGDVTSIPVTAGQLIKLCVEGAAPYARVPRMLLQAREHIGMFEVGDVVVAGDGELLLDVVAQEEDEVSCRVRADGGLRPGRGLLVQGAAFRPRALTPKDRDDLRGIIANETFDAVALSFVGAASEVEEVKRIIGAGGRDLSVVAKIETRTGMTNIEAITMASDVTMAARGDLALTMPWQELPDHVAQIARVAHAQRKPWVLATQIVESIEMFAMPSRAEICDLHRWLDLGAGGVLLTRETAFGDRPVAAVAAVRSMLDAHARAQGTGR